MALTQVSSGGIKNATVATEDIANGAVSNAKIVDGAINNAKVVSDAAIAGSKINPSFTSNLTITNTQPKIFLTDSNNTSDFSIQNENGNLNFYDETNSVSRVRIVADGKIGIGTTSPDNTLHLLYSDSQTYNTDIRNAGLQIENNDGTDNTYAQLHLRAGNSDAYLRAIREGSNLTSLAFLTDNGGSTSDAGEAMRLNSDGDLLIGRTTTIDTSEVLGIKGPSGDHCTLGLTTDGTTNLGIIAFNDSDANFRGQIRYSHSNDTMQFQTANSERINISADGIKFNGDSAAANALDDYEEGTWQPEFDDAYFTSPGTTYNSRAGSYIKIGRMVLARFHVNFAGCSNSNAGPFISAGLPFTPDTSNISSRGLQGTVSFSGIDAPTSTINVNFGYHRLDNNVYYLGINSPRDNTTDGNGSTIQAGDISNGDTISGTVMYISAS